MTKFNKGAKVTSAGGAKCIVLSQARNDGAVLIETAPGVKPYRSTYVPAESLTKGHGRVAATPPPASDLEPGTYQVQFLPKDNPDAAGALATLVEVAARGLQVEAVQAEARAQLEQGADLDLSSWVASAPERVEQLEAPTTADPDATA